MEKQVLEGLRLSIGLDIGHSKAKIQFATNQNTENHTLDEFDTMVMEAIELSQERARDNAKDFTVEYAGKKYFIGNTALIQSNQQEYSGQKSEWFLDLEHDVLVLGAWKRIMDKLPAKPEYIKLATGLPTDYFAKHHKDFRDHLVNLLTPLLDSKQKLQVVVRQQSEAPLINMILLENGRVNPDYDLNNEEFGAVDIGHFTTDISKLVEAQLRETEKSSSTGVQICYERLKDIFIKKNYPHQLRHLIRAMENGSINTVDGKIDVREDVDKAATQLRESVLNDTKRIFAKDKQALRKIVVAGGGAILVIDALKREFPMAEVAQHPKGPRYAVVGGLLKLAIQLNLKEEDELKAKTQAKTTL